MSNSSARIRLAEVTDCERIREIYMPYVNEPGITFTSSEPSLEDIATLMARVKKECPYLVCEIGDEVVGFAFASRVRMHEAYRWNAEMNVYVDSSYFGKGIATALYTALLAMMKSLGYCNLYALITIPSPAVVALHKHFGFVEQVVQKAVGYKLGQWRDVLWMEYRIPGCADPEDGPPLRMDDLKHNEVDTALAMATALLQGVR